MTSFNAVCSQAAFSLLQNTFTCQLLNHAIGWHDFLYSLKALHMFNIKSANDEKDFVWYCGNYSTRMLSCTGRQFENNKE